MRELHTIPLGLTDYRSVWDLQHQLFDLRASGRIPDILLLNQHTPVYTLGKRSDENHLLAGVDELHATGAQVFHIDRGGDVTFHGPGQLVGYPILDLHNYYLDIHRYLRDLEEVLIRTIGEYGLKGRRDDGFTGVWLRGEKIAAIGVKVSRWVTMHGFALNVNTDLRYFDRIIPCGIFHRGVTSMQALLGREVPLDGVASSAAKHFGTVFGVDVIHRDAEEFLQSLHQSELENRQWQYAANQ